MKFYYISVFILYFCVIGNLESKGMFFLSSKHKHKNFPEKVVICGVCKNIEKYLPNTIASIEEVGSLFSNYKVLIYENNSTDATPELLKKWQIKNPRVWIKCEKFTQEELLKMAKSHTWDMKPYRTEAIAYARNVLIEKLKSPEFDDYAYVIMADLDFPDRWNIKGIIDSFNRKEKWDALLANGIDSKGKLFDRYAHRDANCILGPELLGELWWQSLYKYELKFKPTDPLYSVFSSFGGFGIYKKEAIKNCKYSGTVTPELEKFHKQIIQQRKGQNNAHISQYFNMNYEDLTIVPITNDEDNLKYIINSGGAHFPVCCEHITFHAMMILNGYDKIFINPCMVMKYEDR